MSVGSLKFAQCSALPGGCVASPSGAFFRGEPDERGRATRSFRSKRADTIAAGPLDSTQATRAAHAAQSGCAAKRPSICRPVLLLFAGRKVAALFARRQAVGSMDPEPAARVISEVLPAVVSLALPTVVCAIRMHPPPALVASAVVLAHNSATF